MNLFIDTVAFRNEIVHSYDVSIYLLWKKRSADIIIGLYQEYADKILTLLKKLKMD